MMIVNGEWSMVNMTSEIDHSGLIIDNLVE